MPATIEFYGDKCKSGVPVDDRRAYLAHAMTLGYPVVGRRESNWRPLAIVGGGPSVADDLDELRNWKSRGHFSEVWATNGALRYLVEKDVHVDAFVACDSSAYIAKYLEDAPKTLTCYLSSTCHPEAFDAAVGLDVMVWHAGVNDLEYPRGHGVVGGGPTIMTRAPMLAHCLGYRDVHVFGVDSSYETEASHAYETDIPQKKRCKVRLDGVVYETEPEFLHQVAYLQAILDFFHTNGARFTVHGRGLGPDLMKAPVHDEDKLMAALNKAVA